MNEHRKKKDAKEMQARSSQQVAAPSKAFLHQITSFQSSLYAYICTLLGDNEHAQDVLQETNLVLWEKASLFDESRPFRPWAYQFAFQQVRAYRKKLHRDRLVFDDKMLTTLHDESIREMAQLEERLQELDRCVDKLPDKQRDLIRQRYEKGRSIPEMATESGQSKNALTVMLYRARNAIFECMRRRFATGGAS